MLLCNIYIEELWFQSNGNTSHFTNETIRDLIHPTTDRMSSLRLLRNCCNVLNFWGISRKNSCLCDNKIIMDKGRHLKLNSPDVIAPCEIFDHFQLPRFPISSLICYLLPPAEDRTHNCSSSRPKTVLKILATDRSQTLPERRPYVTKFV